MTYLQLLRQSLDQGLPVGKALEFLRGSGASPAEAAQAVQLAIGVDAARAREIVAESRAWKGPRSGVLPAPAHREWYGAIGQHGRSGHGASSVLPHLVRQAQAQGAAVTPRETVPASR
ncbi:hypothetical protein [Ramlibacter humi]|uniref:Uncharacterized protein n=1 Tax=Ramlibacter humi TaxID=2530451 RepID=A0A4Z0BYH8_9BURK|nr:hypothetical protein [Ramlibacter humi]TFZ03742.1 hypothetical protein EZ216_08780 [Ramlibacter humi]